VVIKSHKTTLPLF